MEPRTHEAATIIIDFLWLRKVNVCCEIKRVTTSSDRSDLSITILVREGIWHRERGGLKAGQDWARLGWAGLGEKASAHHISV